MNEQIERMKHNLERFTAVAKAATQGDWVSQEVHGTSLGPELCVVPEEGSARWVVEPSPRLTAEDADFIATFNPPTVLSLLSSLAQLEKLLKQTAKLEGTLAEHRRKLEQLERGR